MHAAASGLRFPTFLLALMAVAGCAGSGAGPGAASPAGFRFDPRALAPDPDPRVDLPMGLFDAGEASWNLRLLSSTPSPPEFFGAMNSDLAFRGNYVYQGNYDGFQIWDISDASVPRLVTGYICPGAQNDISVHGNLLFLSSEYLDGRLDCGRDAPREPVSPDRLRGIRIFDISDPVNPESIANVQTCRGSHTHTVLAPPNDPDNLYVYVAGSAPVRPEEELSGCSGLSPAQDPGSTLFRIEIIQVPLARPQGAAVVSAPPILADLGGPPLRTPPPEELAAVEQRRQRELANGIFLAQVDGAWWRLAPDAAEVMLDSIVVARQGTGVPTSADSLQLYMALPEVIATRLEEQGRSARSGPDQCHDITLYPEMGVGAGACEGYGILLDIRNPIDPRRLAAVADTNFSYWHSATFSNDASKVLFGDEWGGGREARCRATDPMEWGANAIFTIEEGGFVFQSYYKLPAPQTQVENCVAHNGSLIPVPGRDVMVQAWYQGGISVFDWTDPANPFEIAFFDRGPVGDSRFQSGGSWSAYWYNGLIVSSEIARGLDVLELTPSPLLSENEIAAANTVRFEQLNPQSQPRIVWPPSFSLARAYADQLERSGGLPAGRLSSFREELARAEAGSERDRVEGLTRLASQAEGEAARSSDPDRVGALAAALRDLAEAGGG